MTDLTVRLEAATEGSRELDQAIGEHFGIEPDCFEMYGYFDPAKDAPRHHAHYTTSIDAKLPGEDIIMVSEQTTGRWCALQRGAKESGYGATEALARRITALRARQSET